MCVSEETCWKVEMIWSLQLSMIDMDDGDDGDDGVDEDGEEDDSS